MEKKVSLHCFLADQKMFRVGFLVVVFFVSCSMSDKFLLVVRDTVTMGLHKYL